MNNKKTVFFVRMLFLLIPSLISWALSCSELDNNQPDTIGKMNLSSKGTLEDLPPELLTKILEYLFRQEWPKIRLLSKKINNEFNVFDENGEEKDIASVIFLPIWLDSRWECTDEVKKLFFKNHRFNLKLLNLFPKFPHHPPTFVSLKKVLSESLTKPKQGYPIRELHLSDKRPYVYFPGESGHSSLPFKNLTMLIVKGHGETISHKSFVKFCKKNKELRDIRLTDVEIAVETIKEILEELPKLECLHLPLNFRFDQLPFELLKKIPVLSVNLHPDGRINLNSPHLDTIKLHKDKEYLYNFAPILTFLCTHYPALKKISLEITKTSAQKLLDDFNFNFFMFKNITHISLSGTGGAVPHTFIAKLLDCCPKLISLTVDPIPRFDLLDQDRLDKLKKLAELSIPNHPDARFCQLENINDKKLKSVDLHSFVYSQDWDTPQLITFLTTYCPQITCLKLQGWQETVSQKHDFQTIKQLVWKEGNSLQLNAVLPYFPKLKRLDLGWNYDSNLDKALLEKIPKVMLCLGSQQTLKKNIWRHHVYKNLHQLGKYRQFGFGGCLAARKEAMGLLLPLLKKVEKISLSVNLYYVSDVEKEWGSIDWEALSQCKQLKELNLESFFYSVKEEDVALTTPPHQFSIKLRNQTMPPSTATTYFVGAYKKETGSKPSSLFEKVQWFFK